MLNKKLVALWSISLLALYACTVENAGASIDPPAMAYSDPESSSSSEKSIEQGTGQEEHPNISLIELHETIKDGTSEVTIIKSYYSQVAGNADPAPSAASSSSAASQIVVDSNTIIPEANSIIAYCKVDTKTYKIKASVNSQNFIEKTLKMDNFGSACTTIFSKFIASCPTEVHTPNNIESCDENGSISATCTYKDEFTSLDTLEKELSDDALVDCQEI